MSAKRRATTELNHENWDQEEESETHDEESDEFKTAPKDVLEKRVIRVAKRRSRNADGDIKKSVFSGFTGFNKEQKSSFDFLANLTNANNTNNTLVFGASNAKPPTTSSTSLFTSPGNDLNTPFTLPKTSESSVFGTPFNNNSGQSLFTNSKTDSTLKDSGQSLFTNTKTDATLRDNSGQSFFKNINTDSTLKDSSTKMQINPINNDFSLKPTNSSSVVSSPNRTSIFGGNLDNSNSKSLPPYNTNNATPFKIQSTVNNQGSSEAQKNEPSSTKVNDVKLNYYSSLKGLNESVSDWIKQHVEKTPLCILTPIFKDYEKYLKEIQDEYEKGKEELNVSSNEINKLNLPNSTKTSTMSGTPTTSGSSGPSMFTDTGNFKSIFSQNTTGADKNTSSNFSFGVSVNSTTTSSTTTTTTTTQSTGFSFGLKSSPVSANLTSTTGANGGTPFSFGIGKPFSFNANVKQEEPEKQDNEDESPPKVEYNPVVEENSVFDKKCKIFVKKDKDFIDKGVGTLYVKRIEESGKYQLLVRANTNLGNVLINLILSSSLPTQRMGKNNVMMVCIPTPESNPPPVPILIRVKTTEEADELLSILDKYKT